MPGVPRISAYSLLEQFTAKAELLLSIEIKVERFRLTIGV